MKITQITVSYGETQSLPEYSNVKPNLTLTATIDEGDDVAAVEAELWALVKAHVHEQVDLALEGSGKAAKHSTEPRYQVLRTYHEYHRPKDAPPQPPIIAVVLPNEMTLDKETFGTRFVSAGYGSDNRKLRYTHAMSVAREVVDNEPGALIIDCSDGDLTRLAAALPPPAPQPEEQERPF